MWPWLRTKIIHARWAYQRGKSWGGDAVVAGIIGGLVATARGELALLVFAASVAAFTAIGHIDKRYLRFPQAEAEWGVHLNPPLQELIDNVRYLRNTRMAEQNARQRKEQ